ncbi:FtsK/SpoIIIE domain-containing protein [Desulfosporosinus sp. PR]|uniref:FtsK/SpoIIIE domain-containing protein n=1 Tax=Candidatus Desulfosporosinus nitrosoreducens TaxID=3401928 RepID=UPI0027ED7578|nr:FtsK/SpoIIIE domain-containing protein [Desulfosporosinus sp. PR]MDQ7094280.1 FtsK/SpoIIIE domain-containing protein [Desulfosporosinus sp. PR]
MTKQNVIEEVRDQLKHIWLHRRGNDAHAAVQDVIDAIWPKPPRPQIIKKTRLSGEAYKFILTLEPGLGYREFKTKEQLFADAMGGTVQIEKRGKAIFMQASTTELQNQYPYFFEPAAHPGYLPVHFGYSAIGEIIRDLSEMPNLIIAGHPGAGKSNFIHGLIMGLLLNRKTDIRIAVFDFKRLEYSYLRDHVLLITREHEALAALSAINKHLDERLVELESKGCQKIQDYLEQGCQIPFLVMIVDELAEMHDEACQTALNRILRLGRAAGIAVVCATQRPSSTMMRAFGDSKAMFSGTMCFHVRDGVNSRMLLDNDNAALIPTIPGRGIFQWDVEIETQGMFLPIKRAREFLKSINKIEVMNFVEQPQKGLPPR